jgi:hypothetical protein
MLLYRQEYYPPPKVIEIMERYIKHLHASGSWKTRKTAIPGSGTSMPGSFAPHDDVKLQEQRFERLSLPSD